MKVLYEETIIKTTPEELWNFLTNLHQDGNYKKWHPTDHVIYLLHKGSMGKIGGTAYFVEHIGKFTLKLSYTVTKANYPYYIEYTGTPPLSWFHAGKASFQMERLDIRTTKLTACIEYGYKFSFFGKVIDWLIEKIIKYKDVQKHIHEEGEYIKNYLENKNL